MERLFCCINKILPLVYDDSLSYYENVCKLIEIINSTNGNIEELEKIVKKLEESVNDINKNIETNLEKNVLKILKEKISTMIFVEISDSGYIKYNIPSGWESIIFKTTGLDYKTELQPEYGHLVLLY